MNKMNKKSLKITVLKPTGCPQIAKKKKTVINPKVKQIKYLVFTFFLTIAFIDPIHECCSDDKAPVVKGVSFDRDMGVAGSMNIIRNII